MAALVPEGPEHYRKAARGRFLRLRRRYLRRLRRRGLGAYLLGWARLLWEGLRLEGRLWLDAPSWRRPRRGPQKG
ncbi:hypothetical protein [Thermus thermamylovorans]|uniref:Uncharacterized protein n=1 Tax=Thermus thermamylovorans TaxID=2509362 RepID=A0A4Q9B533_9DEIN|nr:hypothetical protein [Thermus thermamylovorans]TBH20697.1 hypothetical protein ETP66_06425 [Thermus thermamylovorans]